MSVSDDDAVTLPPFETAGLEGDAVVPPVPEWHPAADRVGYGRRGGDRARVGVDRPHVR